MSESYTKIFDSVMEILQSPSAKELAPQERVSIMSMARSALAVPATIWSPEDLLEFIPADMPDREAVADDLWEHLDMDITDAEWATIEVYVSNSLREMKEELCSECGEVRVNGEGVDDMCDGCAAEQPCECCNEGEGGDG